MWHCGSSVCLLGALSDMRVYAHIIAIMLAVTLIAKPCAAATTASDGEKPLTQDGLSVTYNTGSGCKTKCLKATIETVRRQEIEAGAQASGKQPSWPDAKAQLTGLQKTGINRAGVANPFAWRYRNSREILLQLCRQLT